MTARTIYRVLALAMTALVLTGSAPLSDEQAGLIRLWRSLRTPEAVDEVRELGGITMWVPADWTVTGSAKFTEHPIFGTSFDVTYSIPSTDYPNGIHTHAYVWVHENRHDETAIEWLHPSWRQSAIEYGVRYFDGREGAHILTEVEPGSDKIHEMIIIPYDGMVYRIIFWRSATDEAELAVFDKMRESIRFTNEEDAP
ncbi:MAG: hypothetical protein FWE20_06570 [Defluviitaleaceae bacterium]|nr:hypothetical protein [Defluviitaleaceae bacterium]